MAKQLFNSLNRLNLGRSLWIEASVTDSSGTVCRIYNRLIEKHILYSNLVLVLVSHSFELSLAYFSSENVSVIVLEILENRFDSPYLAVKEVFPILVVSHPHKISHVVVLNQVNHHSVLLSCLQHTMRGIVIMTAGA